MTTNNITTTAQKIAEDAIEAFGDGTFDSDDMEQLTSDTGMIVEDQGTSFVVWFRRSDSRVVVWSGNDHDYDMSKLVELPVPSVVIR